MSSGEINPAMSLLGLECIAPRLPQPERLSRIGFGLTTTCDLSCVYCFSSAGERSKTVLNMGEYETILDQAQELGVKTAAIIGEGEPLLSADLLPLIGSCAKRGIQSILFTNGLHLSARNIEQLWSHGTSIVVKINSFDPKVHDALVGHKGAHERTMNGLSMLLERGFAAAEPTRLALQSVIVSSNIDSILDLWRFCRRNHIFPYIETLRRCGRASRERSLIVPSRVLKEVFMQVQEWDAEECGVRWKAHPPYMAFSCQQHYGSCFVRVNGDVTPCSGIPVVVGNILIEPLVKVLQRPVFGALRSLREHIEGKCGRCVHRDCCYGCRANAFAVTGNVFGEDPDCWVEA